MKSYIKPAIELVELRSEERLASCRRRYVRPVWFLWYWGCYSKYTNGGGCS
jgi:hypothetical protein